MWWKCTIWRRAMFSNSPGYVCDIHLAAGNSGYCRRCIADLAKEIAEEMKKQASTQEESE